MRPASIEVFADVCCPFTHVGLRRLVDRRSQQGRDEPRLHVRAWPLELVNGTPLDAQLVAEEVEELRRQVAPDLFARFDPSVFPSTSLPALALAATAYRGDLATGEAVSLELRAALFEQGMDIADPDVLAAVAAHHELPQPGDEDREQVVEDWRDGEARGVLGSPHFFVDGRGVFCPTLDIARVEGDLRIRVDEASLSNLLDEALGP